MNRPPRRVSEGSRWIGLRPTRGALTLVLVEVAAYLVYLALARPAWFAEHLALTPGRALWREPWQIVTSGLVHLGFATLFFDGLTLWLFGTGVEERAGLRRLLAVFCGAQLGGALAAALLGKWLTPHALISGCDAGSLGLVAGFGALYAEMPLSLFGIASMKGRTLALFFLGLAALQYLLVPDWVGLAAGGVGAALGWVLATAGAGSGGWLSLRYQRFRMWRLRRRYKVISGGRDQKRYFN